MKLRRIAPGYYETENGEYKIIRCENEGPRGGLQTVWHTVINETPNESECWMQVWATYADAKWGLEQTILEIEVEAEQALAERNAGA